MSEKYFVTSDIHSFYNEFKKALWKKGFRKTNPDHHLIICGDLFDRGPGSVELLKYLLSIPKSRLHIIKGNHEYLLQKLVARREPQLHDISNGTVKTLFQFYKLSRPEADEEDDFDIIEAYQNMLKQGYSKLYSRELDYYEVGDYIFCHGWLPNEFDADLNKCVLLPNWRNASASQWIDATWANGMYKAINDKAIIPGKTIVCGHWHTSYAHVRKRYPGLSDEQYQRLEFSRNDTSIYEPYYDEGIIALDGCTGYTGIINVIVIEK